MKPWYVVWRTALVVLALALVLVACLVLCLRWPAAGAQLFPHAATALVVLAGIAAGKSAVEHLANGSGLAGAAKVLFTDTKPEVKP